jgi:transposase
LVVDTLEHLLAIRFAPADVQHRKQLEALAAEVQEAPGETAELPYGDEGYTGDALAADVAAYGSR